MGADRSRYSILRSIDEIRLKIPDTCPFCHHGIEPDFIIGYQFNRDYYTQYRIVFACPRKKCLELFFGLYSKSAVDIFDRSPPSYQGCSPYRFKEEEFNESINELSKNFIIIYNQAKQAEDRGLSEICGLGYRKALEFLIKDYLISKFPEAGEYIKNNHKFDSLIEKYVTDEKVKFLTRRAAWLGNDHAHYTKKWEDKEVDDLKILIKTSIYWISAEKELEYYQEEMGEGKN